MLDSMSTVIEANDLDAVQAALSEAYANVRIRPHGERSSMRLRQAQIGMARLDHLSFGMGFDAEGDPLELLMFVLLRAGRMTVRSGGEERRVRSGTATLAVQPDEAYTASVRNAEVEAVLLDQHRLTQVADGTASRQGLAIRFTGREPISPEMNAYFRSAHAHVRDDVLGRAGAASHPVVAGEAGRLLAAAALAAFPNTALLEPTGQDRHDASSTTLRRAIAFVDEHAAEDISVGDIAAAAHVSIRAVQLAFRRHRDITPLGYLQRVRLEHAHEDLRTADPAKETVTAVAYRWGYASPSRFAASYKAAYGVLPSHTLRNR